MISRRAWLTGALATVPAALSARPPWAAEPNHARQRQRMIAVIEAHARANSSAPLPDPIAWVVLDAMTRVPRHEFVEPRYHDLAYADRPIPIGYGQTISQPYIVALMTNLLNIGSGAKVLEVGTGSGYQAAVLAALDATTYTVEIIAELGEKAADRLQRTGYTSVETRVGDGYYGWPEAAPFDAIIVTAAASHVPPPLVAQLKIGGRVVIPVGPPFTIQQLVIVTKNPDGTTETRQLLPVAFVPLTGDH